MQARRSVLPQSVFLLGCLTLGLSWQLPGHYPPWVAFQQELCAAAGGALIAWAVAAMSPRVIWPRLAMLALGIASVPLLQRGFGLIPFNSTAVLAALYLLGFALALVTGASLARLGQDRALVPSIMTTLAVGACVAVALALMQWQSVGMPNLWIADLSADARPFANFAQPNHLATLLAFGVTGFVFAYETRRIAGLAAGLGVALLAFGLIMTQSRTAWLFVGVAIAGSLLMRRRVGLRTSSAALGIAAVLFVLGVALWGPLNDLLLLSGSPSLQLGRGSRRELWPMMLAATWYRPWFGYGWTQSGQAQLTTVLDFPPIHEYDKSAHNVVLDLLLWNGWPLGLLIAAGLGWWFVCRLRSCSGGANWAVLLAVATVWLHALVEYPLNYAYFLIPAGILMGIAEGGESADPLPAAPRATLMFPLAIACAVMAWVTMEYVEVEASTRVQRFVATRVGLDKVSSAPRPQVQLLDAELALLDFGTAQPRTGMSEAELDVMRRVVEANAFPGALFRYASALALNGHSREGVIILEKLCGLHSPKYCMEAKVAWQALQQIHPELASGDSR